MPDQDYSNPDPGLIRRLRELGTPEADIPAHAARIMREVDAALDQLRYQRLRAAIDDYNRALKAYGLLGTAWVDHSDELDRLWAAVLEAADLEPMPEVQP